MSVLVQRPHQMPGLMTLQRQHTKPSPRRQPQPLPRNTQHQRSTVSPIILRPDPRSSKRRIQPNQTQTTINVDSNIQHGSIPSLFDSSSSTVSASVNQQLNLSPPFDSSLQSQLATPPATPKLANPATPIRKSRTAPNTPAPLPVPANRRRARSPRPTAKLPPAFPIDEDHSDDQANRNRRAAEDTSANWQQAQLLSKSQGSLFPETSAMRSGSASTPTSPSRPMPVNPVVLAHSPTMPNFPVQRRAGGHARAPSFPNLPLDALFSSAMVMEPVTPPRKAHARGASVSSSLPHPSMLAAAAAKRERTLTGGVTFSTSKSGKFAGANFQRAPDAMVLPKPSFLGGRFGMFVSSSSEESGSSSESDGVVDLGEESEDEVVFALP